VWPPGAELGEDRVHDVFHETLHLWFGGALVTARWWIEGVTDYYAARLASAWRGRPGDLASFSLRSRQDYLRIAAHTSMTMDEEARATVLGDNTTLLVYRKGALAALLLDAAIRRSSGGAASLDDVARRVLALARSRPSRRVAEAEIESIAIAVGGQGIAPLWTRVVAGDSLVSEAEVARALRTVTGVDAGRRPPAEATRTEERPAPGHPKP
jgi:predicted metalloprotease with PDZ domain